MRRRFSQYGLFVGESLKNFRTIGSIVPSGRFLASALIRFVGEDRGRARRILEVGPGTGAITHRIIGALAPDDRLDLVERNARFAQCLCHRLISDEAFQPAARRTRVLHCPVEELARDGAYDLIISSLPLTNFSVSEVERILAALTGLLRPGGTLSFFQYMAIRRIREWISPRRTERARLRGVGEALRRLLRQHEVRRDWVWPNLPPAWVHHVRL